MGRLIEGLWDCSSCGTKGIKGRNRECPNCGKVRDKDTDFYLPNEYSYVSEDEAKKINRNPDWVCDYCGEQLNSDNDKYCRSCGAPRREDSFTYLEYQKKESSNGKVEKDNANYDEREDNKSLNNSKHKFSFSLKKIIIGLLCISMIFGLVYLFVPKDKEVKVLEMGWERSIEIETLKTFTESDWFLPADARLLHTNVEIHHYEEIIDHYEIKTRQVAKERISGYEEYVVGTRDLGNGYFEEVTSTRPVYETYYEEEEYKEPVYRDEPIYQTKYYYEIDRWVYKRSILTKGEDKNVYWGEIILDKNEREGRKNEKYIITGIDKKGKNITLILGYDDWKKISLNTTIDVTVDIFGNAKLKE